MYFGQDYKKYFLRSLCTFCFAILIGIFINNPCFAKPKIQYFRLKTPIRIDQQNALATQQTIQSRLQMQVSADLDASLFGTKTNGLQVSTLVGTGESFTSQWSTMYDFETGQQHPLALSMRQLYLHYVNQYGRLSLGVIPPVKEVVSHTSMDSDGWIRGIRSVINVGRSGVIELVTGSVDHLTAPSVFQIPSEWNYQEFEWTHLWKQRWRTELGAVSLDHQRIVRSEARYHFETKYDLVGEISGEILYNIDASQPAHDLTLVIARHGYRLRLEYSDIQANFGLLGQLVNDYFSLGSVMLVGFEGPTLWKGLNWHSKAYASDSVLRGVLGLSYPLELTKVSAKRNPKGQVRQDCPRTTLLPAPR